jgi:hypothetical protein
MFGAVRRVSPGWTIDPPDAGVGLLVAGLGADREVLGQAILDVGRDFTALIVRRGQGLALIVEAAARLIVTQRRNGLAVAPRYQPRPSVRRTGRHRGQKGKEQRIDARSH